MFVMQGLDGPRLATGDAATDWTSVGLLFAIAGSLLFANAILFRHPRVLVEEHFGGGPQRLVSLRGYTFRRINIHLGFLLLLGGFALQLVGRLAPPVEPALPWAWLVGLLLGIGAAEIVAWNASQRMFLRYLKKHLRAHPETLDGDPALAREVGGLIGLASSSEDSVAGYTARLKAALGAPAGPSEVLAPHPPLERKAPLGFDEAELELSDEGEFDDDAAALAALEADPDELR